MSEELKFLTKLPRPEKMGYGFVFIPTDEDIEEWEKAGEDSERNKDE